MFIEFNVSNQCIEIPEWLASHAKEFSSDMMHDTQLLHLAGTIILANWEEGYIVEIGAYIGLTSVYMAKILRAFDINTRILSIDPFERFNPDEVNPQGRYSNYIYNISFHDVEDICLPLACFSRDAVKVLSPTVALLVIDGSHHYEDVSSDLCLYVPKVKAGGYVFIDDYADWAYPGVVRAVDEYFSDDKFELLHKSNYLIYRKK